MGSKVAVLADKSPSSSSGNATSTGATFRTVTALKVMVVPGKAVRTLARAVVKGKIKNKLQLVDDDGNEIEVEDQDAPENENELEEGDEVVILTTSPTIPRRLSWPGGVCVGGAASA